MSKVPPFQKTASGVASALLYELEDEIVITSFAERGAPAPSIAFSRRDGSMTSSLSTDLPQQCRPTSVFFGLLGLLHLRTGPHLAIIAAEEKVATLWSGDVIHRISRIEFVPVLRRQDAALVAEDEATLRLVQETLDNLPLYFCLSRDISHGCCSAVAKDDTPMSDAAHSSGSSPSASANPAAPASLWRVVDPVYTWNFHMCRSLLEAGDFCTCTTKPQTTTQQTSTANCKVLEHKSPQINARCGSI
jgi:hypothetical protein